MKEHELQECKEEFLIKVISDHLKKYYVTEMERIVLSEDSTKHYSLLVCAQLLLDDNSLVGTIVIERYSSVIAIIDNFLKEFETQFIETKMQVDPSQRYIYKENIHFRLYNLPPVPEYHRDTVSSVRGYDTGKLVQILGTVIRSGVVKINEKEKHYICQKCNKLIVINSDKEQGGIINEIKKCPACNFLQFKLDESYKSVSDYQEITIQERVQNLKVGIIPRSIIVLLEDDLVDSCKAGDDVIICGIVFNRWRTCYVGSKCELSMVLYAISLTLVNTNQYESNELPNENKGLFDEHWNKYKSIPLAGRDLIINSICPSLYGLYWVKLGVLLTLIGGVGSINKAGIRTRGECHLLLVGDPGTGKSELLRFAAKIIPRSVLTTGIGTTSAGLTCSAVKDAGEWVLEAGALVLADRGLCCIDEFNKIREHDRTTIHEAMEQQTLSVAKAGLVTSLNARTTIIAATNPKGQYDVENDISVNTNIGTPLLSRFDLIYIMIDHKKKEHDDEIASYIINKSLCANEQNKTEEYWKIEQLRNYITYVKSNLNPTISDVAELIITTYYQYQRNTDLRSLSRTTTRLLESLIRLSQAHARLMYRNEVLQIDAVIAIILLELSNNTESVTCVELTDVSPKNPEFSYLVIEADLLNKLKLQNQISPTNFDNVTPPPASIMNEITSISYTQTPNYRTFSPPHQHAQNTQKNNNNSFIPSQSYQYTQPINKPNENNIDYKPPIKSTLNKYLENFHQHSQQNNLVSQQQGNNITDKSETDILQTSVIGSMILDESDTDSDSFDLIEQNVKPVVINDKANIIKNISKENIETVVIQENSQIIENKEIKTIQHNIPNSQIVQSQNDSFIPDLSESLTYSSQSSTIPVSVTHKSLINNKMENDKEIENQKSSALWSEVDNIMNDIFDDL